MTGTQVIRHHDNFWQVARSYFQLTKPRIIPLLLITTTAAMAIADHGSIDPFLLGVTLLGGTLAAASAQTLNCIYDRDIDLAMLRTRARPIPSGRVQPLHALIFALLLASSSLALFVFFVNTLSGLLAMSGIAFYMLIYTHILKRHSVWNIVIGGAAGSIPPLVGWAAVTGELGPVPWILFAIVFLWTPPHFWSLALLIKDDYAEVDIPMMPVVKGEKETADSIWNYTLTVFFSSFLLVYPLGACGIVYALTALFSGVSFLKKARSLQRDPFDRERARALFKYSILYMMLLCAGMVIDSFPVTHGLLSVLGSGLNSALAPLPTRLL
jgi:protoheme IX farnesyltransferase